ncbi:MAG: nucleoside hydrolase [Sphingomonadales bacterium]
MSQRRAIILDCDPGQDDAVNLLLAFARRDVFDIVGITTVAGNVPLALTQKNARIITQLAGVSDVPVHAGCDRPLRRPPITAHQVHGQTGIDGMALFEPSLPLASMHGVDFIIECLRQRPAGTVTLVPTGPLTNIAAAFNKAPDIVARVAAIVLMGGAMREAGNWTPSAEFNILVDPDAADIVLQSGIDITMIGLDATHQVLCTPERLAPIRKMGTAVGDAVYGMLNFFNRHDSAKYGSQGAPLHDPCTIAWLLAPDLFEAKQCNISVETQSALTLGHTAVDFWHVTGKPRNARWIYGVDADGFFQLLSQSLANLG